MRKKYYDLIKKYKIKVKIQMKVENEILNASSYNFNFVVRNSGKHGYLINKCYKII